MIEGFGVHTFRLLNAKGDRTFVKFHWRPKLGLQSTVWDEAVKLQGADHDFHRRDLFEAIEAGDFPEWEFGVQLFTQEAGRRSSRSTTSTPTKLIPEELVPLTDDRPHGARPLARQLLRRDRAGRLLPRQHRARHRLQQRSAAAGPAVLLPRHAADRAWADPTSTRSRSTRPSARSPTMQRDGHMQMQVPRGRVNYEPSSLQAGLAARRPRAASAASPSPPTTDAKGRIRAESLRRPLQPGAAVLSAARPRSSRRTSPRRWCSNCPRWKPPHVREAMVGHLRHIDADLAQRVADGLGMDALPPAPPAAVRPHRHDALARAADHRQDEGHAGGPRASASWSTTAPTPAPMRGAAQGRRGRRRHGQDRRAEGRRREAERRQAAAGRRPARRHAVGAVRRRGAGAVRATPASALAKEAAAVDFVRDAFGHLKAIAVDAGAHAVLKAGGIDKDAGVVMAGEREAFIDAARTRQWDREPNVRTLA